MLVQDTSSAICVNNFLNECRIGTYRSDLDLPSDSHWSLLDCMQPKYRSLRQVDDWRSHHRSKDTTIADSKSAASHIFEGELVVTCLT